MSAKSTRTKNRSRPAQTARRLPPPRRKPSRLRRAAPWLGGAGVVAIVAVLLIASGEGGSPGATAGSFVGGDLHTLVVDPAQPQRLFVGGHQAVAASSDGGRTWTQVASLRDADAMGWAFLGDSVWMGGHPGLRRSIDGGTSFKPGGGELSSTDVHALGGGGGVLYAASPGRGLLASSDDGQSWQVRSAGAGRAFMGAIVVDASDAQHLVAPDMQQGVVESRDGGRSWRPLGSPGMAMSVTAIGGDTSKLIVAGRGQAARSNDGGRTWQPIAVPEGTMVVAAGADRNLYAAALEGDAARVSRSTDEGAAWRPLNP